MSAPGRWPFPSGPLPRPQIRPVDRQLWRPGFYVLETGFAFPFTIIQDRAARAAVSITSQAIGRAMRLGA